MMMMVMNDAHKMQTPQEVLAVHHADEVEAAATAGPRRAPPPPPSPMGRKAEFMQVTLRALCFATSVTALSFTLTATQSSTVSIYGFMLPVRSKWSFSPSFRYLAGVAAAAAAHSLLQLLIGIFKLLKRFPLIPSTNYAWFIFLVDQVFAYATISAGSAASGVSNLNRTGIQHTPLPNFCKPLYIFCDHIAVSIALTFFSCFLLSATVVQEVIWLSRAKH